MSDHNKANPSAASDPSNAFDRIAAGPTSARARKLIELLDGNVEFADAFLKAPAATAAKLGLVLSDEETELFLLEKRRLVGEQAASVRAASTRDRRDAIPIYSVLGADQSTTETKG